VTDLTRPSSRLYQLTQTMVQL